MQGITLISLIKTPPGPNILHKGKKKLSQGGFLSLLSTPKVFRVVENFFNPSTHHLSLPQPFAHRKVACSLILIEIKVVRKSTEAPKNSLLRAASFSHSCFLCRISAASHVFIHDYLRHTNR
jgi:hypothetical protein